MAHMRRHAKFREGRSNRAEILWFFVIFKMVAAATFDFQKFEILTVIPL